MFGRKSPPLTNQPATTLQTQKELSGRYASLFMLCYQRRDVSGMHITLTAFTHTLHALALWDIRKALMEETRAYIIMGGFPDSETKALDWLLHHYFEQANDADETVLLGWYQALDDEWVLRKKLRALFPEKPNSELTLLIAAEHKKVDKL